MDMGPQVSDGTVYEGIVHSLAPDGEGSSVVLHWAKPLRGPAAATQAPPVKLLTIPATDLVQLIVRDIDLTPEGLSGQSANGAKSFETDSEISRGRGGYALYPAAQCPLTCAYLPCRNHPHCDTVSRQLTANTLLVSGPMTSGWVREAPDAALKGHGPLVRCRVERELTRWQPEGPHLDPGLGEGPARFGRPTAGSVTGWDQFEVNRERFQVRADAQHVQPPSCARLAACSWMQAVS
jgi:hypothetical protein